MLVREVTPCCWCSLLRRYEQHRLLHNIQHAQYQRDNYNGN